MSTAAKVSSVMWKALCRCRRNKVKEEEIAIANTIDFASTTNGEKTVVLFAGDLNFDTMSNYRVKYTLISIFICVHLYPSVYIIFPDNF